MVDLDGLVPVAQQRLVFDSVVFTHTDEGPAIGMIAEALEGIVGE